MFNDVSCVSFLMHSVYLQSQLDLYPEGRGGGGGSYPTAAYPREIYLNYGTISLQTKVVLSVSPGYLEWVQMACILLNQGLLDSWFVLSAVRVISYFEKHLKFRILFVFGIKIARLVSNTGIFIQ